MSMGNYRDLSTSSSDVSAGFQFEFYCEVCGETNRSAFTPYRKGQLTGWLTRFAFMFTDLHKAGRATGAFADAGASGAKADALAEAQAVAMRLYQRCETCRKWACANCWNESTGTCKDCASKAATRATYDKGQAASAGGALCPNCNTPTQGGRFCPECGFDLASTHKSCPGCGATMPRSARFCTDCGHGF